MTFKKSSLMVLVAFVVLTFIGVGLADLLGFEFGGYLLPFLHVIGALILLLEVGIKRFSNISRLDNIEAQQYITLVVALVSLLNGILTFPEIGIEIAFLKNISSFVLIIIGIFLAIEAVTNQ